MDPNSAFTPQPINPEPEVPPQQAPQQAPQFTPNKSSRNKSGMLKKILLGVLILLLIAGGVGAYLWRDAQANQQKSDDAATIERLERQVDELEASVGTAVTDTSNKGVVVLTADDIAEIKVAIRDNDTTELKARMADNVHVIIAGTEMAADRTATEAISDMAYIDDATTPWNFDISDTTLAEWSQGTYNTYFRDNSIVGQSANGYVIVVNFDTIGRINGVLMTSNADLLK